MKIYVVRHGETDWNNKHLVQGLIDNPLNEKGREQAKNISEFFKDKNIKKFYSSPLCRAVETLEIIKKENKINAPTITLNGFLERDFGSLEGAKVKDFLSLKDPQSEPGYEQNKDLEKRVAGKLDEIEKNLQDLSNIGDTVDAERRDAFNTDMTPDQIKTFSIKNRLPKNVIYKMLEKYHYLTFLKKCKKILSIDKRNAYLIAALQ